MNFVEELNWRGMIHTIKPGTEELMEKEMVTAYLGIDPTADSLHIGHLVGIMLLKHLQVCGHRPIALVGGATGMIGDPSGKSDERNLLDEATLRHNQEAIKTQLSKFLDFESESPNKALLVNNYDWMKEFSFLGFIRDVGKHITVNYMIAKDSVKKRMEGEGNGISFTEFTYQLVQGYDFLHLYRTLNCKLQLGGSDQWGNITTGTELIRRMDSGEAFALTCPLITKADGGKFGKTEKGNVWLDAKYTSSYSFYQFWMNVSDQDAEKYIKIFTLLKKEEVEALIEEHSAAPHQRILQKKLAEELTVMVHSRKDFEIAVEASGVLFGRAAGDFLNQIDEQMFLSIFDGVPQYKVEMQTLEQGIGVLDLLSVHSSVFPSKSEARRNIAGITLNQKKVESPDFIVNCDSLIKDKYIFIQKGKKHNFLILVE